ncbi:hypothetical protein ACUY4Q_004976 (plasmid) [Phytobacter sp. AG2a]|jgi:hypothetical protein
MPKLYIFKNKKLVSRTEIDEYVDNFSYQDSKKNIHTLPVHILFITFPPSDVRAVLVASHDIPDSSMIMDEMNRNLRKK